MFFRKEIGSDGEGGMSLFQLASRTLAQMQRKLQESPFYITLQWDSSSKCKAVAYNTPKMSWKISEARQTFHQKYPETNVFNAFRNFYSIS